MSIEVREESVNSNKRKHRDIKYGKRGPGRGGSRRRHGRRARKNRIRAGVGAVLCILLAAATIYWGVSQLVIAGVGGGGVNSGQNESRRSGLINLDDLSSDCAVLVDRESGSVLAEKQAGKRIYPASMTKIMTALLAAEYFEDLDELIVMPEDIYSMLYVQNAAMAGFQPGETVTVRDLLYGVLLPSGAECCLALAEEIAGSERVFADRMNQKAEELGMTGTHFSNATGLHDENHYSTAEDIALLLKTATDNPVFREVFESSSYRTADRGAGVHEFESTLFKYLDTKAVAGGEILGGKTGYTEEAGLCLASMARVAGKEYILVTAHAEGDHQTQQYHILDAVKVYNRIQDQ